MNHALSFLAERRGALRHFYRIGIPPRWCQWFPQSGCLSVKFILLNQRGEQSH
jgi:hypothetical protein